MHEYFVLNLQDLSLSKSLFVSNVKGYAYIRVQTLILLS